MWQSQRRWIIGVVVALLLVILCYFSAQLLWIVSPKTVVEETASTEEQDLIVVGFSQIGSESVWRTANTASIQKALTKENGFFLNFNNARQKQENQIKAIRGFISQRVDYIVFSPVTEYGWETVLEEARAAGIPVILVDRQIDEEYAHLYTTCIGTDKYEEGKNAGVWLETYLKKCGMQEEEINIVVLQGTPGSTAELGRTSGFCDVAAMHENWNILEQINAEFTTAKGEEVMTQLLEKYEDIDVVVSQNDDMTFGAIDAINDAGLTTGVDGDIIMISFDAVRDALELVQQGIINVDIECNPEQGDAVAEVIHKLENGETVEKAYMVEERVFTPENVGLHIDSRTY